MKIKKLASTSLDFIIKRFIELFGLIIFIISILLLTSLLSYAPEDPNFIFPQDKEIQNILGFKGSFTADLFFQSLGLISILISISLFFTSINIIRSKKNFSFNNKFILHSFIFTFRNIIFFYFLYKLFLVAN